MLFEWFCNAFNGLSSFPNKFPIPNKSYSEIMYFRYFIALTLMHVDALPLVSKEHET